MNPRLLLLALGYVCSRAVNAQSPTNTITNLPQLSSDIANKYLRFTECSQLLATCQPTLASCASSVCATCTGLGQGYINTCCAAAPTPASCFLASLSAGGPGIYSSGVTPPPAPKNTAPYGPLDNSGFKACASISDYSSICESFSPGFATASAFAFQAPCLCYQGTSWAPNVYDGYVQTCQSYLGGSTASMTFTRSAPCHDVGDVIVSLSRYESTKSGQATPTSAPRPTKSSSGTSYYIRVGLGTPKLRSILKLTILVHSLVFV